MDTSDDWNISESYKPLDEEGYDPSEWKSCPKCNQKPRVWVFDNGRVAKCKCYGRYDYGVRAPSIMEYLNYEGTWCNYNPETFRDNWNSHIDKLCI